MRHLGTSGNTVWIGRGFDKSIQTAMPEMVIFFVAFKNKFITYIVAGTHARIRIGTILFL